MRGVATARPAERPARNRSADTVRSHSIRVPFPEVREKIVITVKQPPIVKAPEQLELPPTKMPVFSPLGGGLYRHNKTGTMYERPWIAGRRTWRSLETSREKTARDEMARRRHTDLASRTGSVISPYARPASTKIGEIIQAYIKAGCPDRLRNERDPGTKQNQLRHCANLLDHLGRIDVEDITLRLMDEYCDRRVKEITARNGSHRSVALVGFPTVNYEITTLNHCLRWAVRCEAIRYNPLASCRQTYGDSSKIRHCRDFRAHDIDDVHEIARWIFSHAPNQGETMPGSLQKRTYQAEPAGWQFLFECLTGNRSSETLSMRTDAQPGQPGWIELDRTTGAWKVLHVRRDKGGINPFVVITPALQECIQALLAWKKPRYPKSPWYFPSPATNGQTALTRNSLNQVLQMASRHFKRKLTSHGCRSFYVTVRRSWGISDPQIAAEIGQRSGGDQIVKVYGDIPTNWRSGDGPKMSWTPSGPPAWSVLKQVNITNVIQLTQQVA